MTYDARADDLLPWPPAEDAPPPPPAPPGRRRPVAAAASSRRRMDRVEDAREGREAAVDATLG